MSTAFAWPSECEVSEKPSTAPHIEAKWELLTSSSCEFNPVAKSASRDDVILESPNWLHARLVRLEDRRRINDPRRRRTNG